MIHEFSKKRIIFLPVSWANSVARWILGICSPTGTIKVRNEADAGRDKSMTLDVDIPVLVRSAKHILDNEYVSKQEVKALLASMCDGQSIILKDGVLTINREWLDYNN